jgi:hypothetical protein
VQNVSEDRVDRFLTANYFVIAGIGKIQKCRLFYQVAARRLDSSSNCLGFHSEAFPDCKECCKIGECKIIKDRILNKDPIEKEEIYDYKKDQTVHRTPIVKMGEEDGAVKREPPKKADKPRTIKLNNANMLPKAPEKDDDFEDKKMDNEVGGDIDEAEKKKSESVDEISEPVEQKFDEPEVKAEEKQEQNIEKAKPGRKKKIQPEGTEKKRGRKPKKVKESKESKDAPESASAPDSSEQNSEEKKKRAYVELPSDESLMTPEQLKLYKKRKRDAEYQKLRRASRVKQ